MAEVEFVTRGRCRFAPPLDRSGRTQRRDGESTEWWMILECDRELGRYYRSLYATARHQVRRLQEPLWRTHISVVRGEHPIHEQYWRECEDQELEIVYEPFLEIHRAYAVLPVRCEAALDYRERLGLSREPAFPLHMTIGNLKDAAP